MKKGGEFGRILPNIYGRKADEENFGNKFRTFCLGSVQRYVHVLFNILTCYIAENIEWIIEDQAFSPSYSFTFSRQNLVSLSLSSCVSPTEYICIRRRNRGSVSALSAEAYTKLCSPEWADFIIMMGSVRQEVAIATLCILWCRRSSLLTREGGVKTLSYDDEKPGPQKS